MPILLSSCIAFLAGASLCGLLPGCDRTPTSTTTGPAPARQNPERGYIAFIGTGESDPIWPILRHSAEEYARQFGTLQVRYVLPAGNSPKEQLDLLRSLNDEKLRGICIQTTDPAALDGVLRDFINRGIAVVSMVRELPPGGGAGFSGVDEEQLGQALADTTARWLEGKGDIMVLHAGTENPTYGPRLEAFRQEIRKHNHIEIFAQADCHADALEARKILRERAERYPRLSAWASVGDWPARGLRRDGDLGLPESCKLILCGGTPEQWHLIRSGRCPAIVTIDYSNMGARALQFCENLVRKASAFESRFVAPVRVVDAQTLDAYLADWSRWGGRPPQTQAAHP